MAEYKYINPERIEDFFGEDLDIFETFIQKFKVVGVECLTRLSQAAESNDNKNINEAAHEYKGMLVNLFCPLLIEQAQNIENMGAAGAIGDEASKLVDAMKLAHAELLKDLDVFILSIPK